MVKPVEIAFGQRDFLPLAFDRVALFIFPRADAEGDAFGNHFVADHLGGHGGAVVVAVTVLLVFVEAQRVEVAGQPDRLGNGRREFRRRR